MPSIRPTPKQNKNACCNLLCAKSTLKFILYPTTRRRPNVCSPKSSNHGHKMTHGGLTRLNLPNRLGYVPCLTRNPLVTHLKRRWGGQTRQAGEQRRQRSSAVCVCSITSIENPVKSRTHSNSREDVRSSDKNNQKQYCTFFSPVWAPPHDSFIHLVSSP